MGSPWSQSCLLKAAHRSICRDRDLSTDVTPKTLGKVCEVFLAFKGGAGGSLSSSTACRTVMTT